MRQSGYLAAACLYALERAPQNLKLDNENAKRLADGIEKISRGLVDVDAKNVQTNIVHMKILKKDLCTQELAKRLATVS